MAQHIMTIENQSFPSTREDLNECLEAIKTMQSGQNRPSTAELGTMWLDTTNQQAQNKVTMKFYDGAADINFATIDIENNTVNFFDQATTFALFDDENPRLFSALDLNGKNLNNGDAEQLAFTSVQNSVNEFNVHNASTGNSPKIQATGTDQNIGMEFQTKGTGVIKFHDLAYITQQALTSNNGDTNWDAANKPNAFMLTTENTTFQNPTNSVEGSYIALEINYDGEHDVSFTNNYRFAGGTTPNFTSTNGKSDLFIFRYNGNVWQEMGRSLNLNEN